MITLCECDWDGLGPVPPHMHVTRSLVKRPDDGTLIWIPNFPKDLNPRYEVVEEIEEISFSVPWKDLYRAS